MISVDVAVSERKVHLFNLDSGKFTSEHAHFYAKRAAKHDIADFFAYNRVFSQLMSGIMVPHDVPRRPGELKGAFDA